MYIFCRFVWYRDVYIIRSFVQFWVCLQLPLVGQPESQLGWGEEGSHDGTTARGPQICYSPGCPQGESLVVFIRRTQVSTYSSLIFFALTSLLTWCRRSRGRTSSACRTPQPPRRCTLMGRSGWSRRCCSPGLAKVQTHLIYSYMVDTLLFNIYWKHLLYVTIFMLFCSLWVPSDQLQEVWREELHIRLCPGSQPFHTRQGKLTKYLKF